MANAEMTTWDQQLSDSILSYCAEVEARLAGDGRHVAPPLGVVRPSAGPGKNGYVYAKKIDTSETTDSVNEFLTFCTHSSD